MSTKKISTAVAFVLATASLVVPATAAQASVAWHSNGALVGTTHVGTIFWGSWEDENALLGKTQCHIVGSLPVWNEGGLARATVESLAINPCTSEPSCPDTFVTAEAPVEVTRRKNAKGEEVAEARRGQWSLPWQGEGLEAGEGAEKLKQVKLNGVKLTMVAPCDSLEVPIEGTLELNEINGAKNVLHPSHLEFGRTGLGGSLSTKDLPTEKEEDVFHLTGEIRDVGESVQLITLE